MDRGQLRDTCASCHRVSRNNDRPVKPSDNGRLSGTTQAPVSDVANGGSGAHGAAGQGQHILYIDDDQALLYLIERLLKRRGYKVSGFADPKEAIESVRTDPSRYDLVITDFNMPGFSGIDVAHEIRRSAPGIPIAVASGYITDELRNEAAAVGVSDLIFKPNAAGEFCDVVQRLLAERVGKTTDGHGAQ